MRSYLYLAAFIGGNLGVSTAAFAQNDDGHTQNLYLAPFEVIKNHPDCNEPGETAYEFDLNVRDVAYRLHQDGTRKRNIFVNHNNRETVVPESEQDVSRICYRSIMRGVERIEFEVPCAREAERDPLQSFLDESAPILNLELKMSVCQSITDFQLLETRWVATFLGEGDSVSNDGALEIGEEVIVYEEIITDGVVVHRSIVQPPRVAKASLWYSSASMDHYSFSDVLNGVASPEWTVATDSRSVAVVNLNCVPVPSFGAGIDGLFADTNLAFIPTAILPENCSVGACAVRIPSSEVHISQSSRNCVSN